jgi:hypothetical protein
MMIRFGLLVGMLAVGLMALPQDCFGFDPAGNRTSAQCGTRRTVPCTVALVALPSEATVPSSGALAPLPLPRPPNLGQPTCKPSERVSAAPEVCR